MQCIENAILGNALGKPMLNLKGALGNIKSTHTSECTPCVCARPVESTHCSDVTGPAILIDTDTNPALL